MCQDIEQDFRVAFGIDMAVIGLKQLRFQRMRVGQIAVVHQHDAKRCVDVKRLRLFFTERIARCGVAHLPQATIARQRTHVAGAEHIFDHALGFVHEKLAVQLRGNTSRVLATVLQEQQSVINQLVDRGGANNADYSAHKIPNIKTTLKISNSMSKSFRAKTFTTMSG